MTDEQTQQAPRLEHLGAPSVHVFRDGDVEVTISLREWGEPQRSPCSDYDDLIWTRGVGFSLESSSLDEDRLIKTLTQSPSAPLSASLTGHYGLIHVRRSAQGQLCVALHSDRLRSFPLFYAIRGARLLVSDDALWLSERLEAELHPLSEVSMWRTAQLVSGHDTLWRGIRQLRASERVCWEHGVLSAVDGELFVHDEDDELSASEVKTQLRDAARQYTARLIAFANGAQIVVPLSGGFDSRLVLTALVEAKYPKLLAFTYGKERKGEAEISERLAQQLGVPWCFVRYTQEKWSAWAMSEDAAELERRARSAGVLLHVQDPVAIKELVERGDIEQDSVLVYGHSGDVHAGSVIDEKSMKASLSAAGYVDLLARKYFRFQADTAPPHSRERASTLDVMLRAKLARELSEPFRARAADGVTREALIDELERWFWRERCSKYLVHSMRTHEMYGLRWWFPLWDEAFTSVWMRVPLKHRGRVGVYHEHVDEYFTEVAGVAPPRAVVRASSPRPTPWYKRLLLRSRLVQVLRLRSRHPFGWYALIPIWRHFTSAHPEEHLNVHLVDRELRWWRSERSTRSSQGEGSH